MVHVMHVLFVFFSQFEIIIFRREHARRFPLKRHQNDLNYPIKNQI